MQAGPPVLNSPAPVVYQPAGAGFMAPFNHLGHQMYYLNQNMTGQVTKVKKKMQGYTCFRIIHTAIHLQFILIGILLILFGFEFDHKMDHMLLINGSPKEAREWCALVPSICFGVTFLLGLIPLFINRCRIYTISIFAVAVTVSIVIVTMSWTKHFDILHRPQNFTAVFNAMEKKCNEACGTAA